MKNVYYVGTLGSSGRSCIGTSEKIEKLPEGEFANFKSAKRAAAELAVRWANERGSENKEVRLAVVCEGSTFDVCRCIAIGVSGRDKVKWD